MKKIWSADTKHVNGKTLANADTVTNTASVARDHNLFDFIKYLQYCWANFKEEYEKTKKDVMGD